MHMRLQAERSTSRSRSTLSKNRPRTLSQSGLDAEDEYQAAAAPVYGKMSRAAHILAHQAAPNARGASRIARGLADDAEESESVLSGRSSRSWCERLGSIKALSVRSLAPWYGMETPKHTLAPTDEFSV